MDPTLDQVTSLGRALLVVGDQWNLLIISEAFRGARRFQDFKDRLGASDPILAQRLRALVEDGVLDVHPYSEHPPRSEYRLSEQGRGLWGMLVAMWVWQRRWTPASIDTEFLIHDECGARVIPVFGCARCGARGVDHRHTHAITRPDATFAQANPARRYRRPKQRPADDTVPHADIIDLLGDRWSISVLGGAMLGLRRFGEFQRELEISPYLLSERLSSFVHNDVMQRALIASDGRRQEYRLLPKGVQLLPVFAAINAWAIRWFPEPEGPALGIVHDGCGELLEPAWWCDICGGRLERRTVRYEFPAVATGASAPSVR